MRRHALLLLAVLLLAAPPAVPAQSRSRNATLRAHVDALARLSLSSLSVTFPDADPDTVPQIPAGGGPITIQARARAFQGGTIVLTLEASDDLRSGTDVIPASAITWTATGTGFVGGTLVAGEARAIGTWTNSGARTGTQTFYLANSWSWAPGTYSLTLTYTLAAP